MKLVCKELKADMDAFDRFIHLTHVVTAVSRNLPTSHQMCLK